MRFLSRIWDDPKCGGFNNDNERLFAMIRPPSVPIIRSVPMRESRPEIA